MMSIFYNHISSAHRLQKISALIGANFASFICGTSFGWTSPEIPKLKNITTTPLHYPITDSQEGWIGSLLPLAAAIGPIGGGVLADIIGRKKSILIGTFPFLVAFILNIFAKSIWFFYIGRFLCGLGVGIIFTVIPMYIGEISDDDVRGSLGSFMQLFIVIGLLFSYSLGPFLSVRTFNIILVFPPIIFLITFLLFIPDSPYYLLQTGNTKDALDAMIKLRGREVSFVQKEMEVMKVQVEIEQRNKGTFVDIFKSKGLRNALFLSVGLVACQQLSGINIVLFFAQDLFTDAGVTLAPEICTIIIGVVQILASATTPLLVEKWGKRVLLLISGLGMGISQGLLAVFFYLKDAKYDISTIGWLPIISLVTYMIFYCLGFGPLPWAVMGELFPGNVKSNASSATASVCWILGFFITKYFNLLTLLIGTAGSFGFFTGCCLISVVFVYKFLPETSGKSVHEIQYMLSGGSRKASYV